MENSEHIISSMEKEYGAWLDWDIESDVEYEDPLGEEVETPQDIEMGVKMGDENPNYQPQIKMKTHILPFIYVSNQIYLIRTNIAMLLCFMLMNNML